MIADTPLSAFKDQPRKTPDLRAFRAHLWKHRQRVLNLFTAEEWGAWHRIEHFVHASDGHEWLARG